MEVLPMKALVVECVFVKQRLNRGLSWIKTLARQEIPTDASCIVTFNFPIWV